MMMSKGRLFLGALAAILSSIIAISQSPGSSANGVILANPTTRQLRVRPDLATTRNAFGTIQTAIASQPGPTQIYLSCGVYTDNIVITTSDVRLIGEERGCVQIQPADPTKPVITIDSTISGTSGIRFDEVSNLTILCPLNLLCSDGLKVIGRVDINQPNDFHKFSRLGVYGPFQNGVNLAGRTIWTVFENVEVGQTRGNGITVASPGTTNELTFRNVRSAQNSGYGIYVNNTQVDLANGIVFDEVNAEYNGRNTSLANCAGVYLTGVAQVNILNSYFEGNCEGNTADSRAAEIRLTGTFAQSVNITNSVFNLQYGEGGIYNDAFLTTGDYSGNKFDTSTSNFTIYIATAHTDSNVVIGENFNANPIVMADDNGMTHVRMLAPFGFDYQPVTSVSANSLDVTNRNGVALYYGPYTINSFTGGHVGQLLNVTAFNMSGHVLTNDAGGIGQIAFPDGQNRTLNAGESLLLIFDGASWRPMEGAVTTQARFVATITTTAGPVDQVSVPGLTAASHCLFSPRNALAAAFRATFLTTDNGTLTLNHMPTAGAVFDVFCSSR